MNDITKHEQSLFMASLTLEHKNNFSDKNFFRPQVIYDEESVIFCSICFLVLVVCHSRTRTGSFRNVVTVFLY
jgi:hypothetical protein